MKKYLIIFLFICFFSTVSRSNIPSYCFKQITIEHGLSQSSVSSILRDYRGMLWIGTRSGLNCYNQHELKKYFHDKDKKYSLPGNQIYAITEDSLKNLWVATNQGLAKYNYADELFYPVLPQRIFASVNIPGGILFAGNNMLYVYAYENEEIREVCLFPDIEQQYYDNYRIFKLLPIDGKRILVATKYEGLFIYDLRTNRIEKLPFGKCTTMLSVYIDVEGSIYYSCYENGLFCYDAAGNLVLHYTTANSALSNDIILDIQEKDGNIWLATDGGGICVLNPRNGQITTIQHIPGDVNSLPVNSITVLYKDHEDDLWAGSVRGGIFGIKETHIRTYTDVTLNSTNGLSEKVVISMYEDDERMLWIGTDGGGINKYNPFTDTFTHYPSTYGEKVVSITNLSRSELLISLYGKGVFTFNKSSGQFAPFVIVDETTNKEECFEGFMPLVYNIGNNTIAIFSQNTFIYNIEKGSFVKVNTEISNRFLGALNLHYVDESIVYVSKNNEVFALTKDDYKLFSLFVIEPDETIQALNYDGKHTVWIGTDRGLSCYNLISKKLKRIETKLFNSVSYLLLDKRGRLWVSSQNMLFSYIIDESRFVIWDESDGFSSNEILPMYLVPSRTSNIYLAGTNGLVRIDEAISYSDKEPPKANLMDVMYNGSSYIDQIKKNDGIITLPWNYTSLSLRLDPNEKDIFRRTLYRYTVIGLNDRYIESYSPRIDLPQLTSGTYSIVVSCNTKSGNWSQPVKVLTIIVMPPWYKKGWFIFLALFAGTVIIFFIVYSIIKRKENKIKRERIEHEQALNEEKIRFLLNVSHELRTPLTLIYGPLNRLMNKNFDELEPKLIKEQLTIVYKQSRQMKNIINMVLDLSRINFGHEALQKKSHPLNKWILSVYEEFINEFKEKNIRLAYRLDDAVENVWFDQWKCHIILSNMLMNAFKYSEPGTQVVISSQLMDRFVRISVTDEGIGLHSSDIENLFNRFYQGKNHVAGSGIGLSYSKTLVEQHGGRIGVYNNPVRGATFYYELPLVPISPLSIHLDPKPLEKDDSPLLSDINAVEISSDKYSVLIVEDTPELRMFIRDSLQNSFRYVYTAEDGLKALEIIKQKQPDIIVSDVIMPHMDGYELCRRVKNDIEISHIPVILLTARSDSDSTTFGYKLGADFYIPKPFEVDFLHMIIQNILRTREIIKERYKNSIVSIVPQEATISNADEKFMIKLNQVITGNLSHPELNVKFLTEHMAMSRSSFYDKVKALTGLGVNDYIVKIRIEKAADLLTHTDMNITEVASETGFIYQRYFSTIFKQTKGVTPTQFKKEQQNKQQQS